MFSHIRMRSAGLVRRRIASSHGWLSIPVAALVCGLLLQACANPPPPPLAGNDPSDADARAPAAVYRPATEPYISRRPVDPKAWRDQNETVAPQKR